MGNKFPTFCYHIFHHLIIINYVEHRWFWEANCFIAGRFGVLPFAVHSIAYQILPLCYMLPLGFSMGLSVRMGALFSKSASKVKQLVIIVMIFNLFMAGSISFFIYYYRDLLISFFTQDEDVKKVRKNSIRFGA